MNVKRNQLRTAIEVYRHAERWHMKAFNNEVWEDGFRMMQLADMVCLLLCGRVLRRKGTRDDD